MLLPDPPSLARRLGSDRTSATQVRWGEVRWSLPSPPNPTASPIDSVRSALIARPPRLASLSPVRSRLPTPLLVIRRRRAQRDSRGQSVRRGGWGGGRFAAASYFLPPHDFDLQRRSRYTIIADRSRNGLCFLLAKFPLGSCNHRCQSVKLAATSFSSGNKYRPCAG
jgi:hypothetical protein